MADAGEVPRSAKKAHELCAYRASNARTYRAGGRVRNFPRRPNAISDVGLSGRRRPLLVVAYCSASRRRRTHGRLGGACDRGDWRRRAERWQHSREETIAAATSSCFRMFNRLQFPTRLLKR